MSQTDALEGADAGLASGDCAPIAPSSARPPLYGGGCIWLSGALGEAPRGRRQRSPPISTSFYGSTHWGPAAAHPPIGQQGATAVE